MLPSSSTKLNDRLGVIAAPPSLERYQMAEISNRCPDHEVVREIFGCPVSRSVISNSFDSFQGSLTLSL
jgi:hypothetical protein